MAALPMMALSLIACGSAPPPEASPTATLPDVRGPWADYPAERIRVSAEDAPALGAEAPLVTLVLFTDFECPYCRRFAPTVARLAAEHPDEIRLAFRHLPLPFHERALLAAEAAMEARAQGGDEMFWRYHDRLFETNALAPDDLLAHAEALGLDVARFRIALRGHVHSDAIEDDLDLADRVGARGTPSAYLNGRPLRGAVPFQELEAVFEEERALALTAMQRGVPRELLYAAAMREASDRPAPERERPPARPRRQLDEGVIYAVPAGDAPQIGPDDAPVTIVMFSDFQCPFCSRALSTIDELRARHPDRIRLLYRHNPLPFHRDALPAALAAAEAGAQRGDEGFWQMLRLLFANPRALSSEDLEGYAAQLGLDLDRFRAALEGQTHLADIEADQRLAARLGARSTPTFYVNGRLVRGAQPLQVFAEAFDDALERAEAAASEGAAPADVYGALIADAAEEGVFRGPAERAPTPDRLVLPAPASSPRRGASDPELVVQVFSDFQCPFCARVNPTLERLLETHPEIQIVFRHYPLPFHRDARPAANAALEVQRQRGDEAFWAFHDRVFAQQRQLDPETLAAHARAVGADPAEVEAAIREDRHAAAIDADVEAVRASGARIGTPAVLIGDHLVMGAQPYPVFEEAVQAELTADE